MYHELIDPERYGHTANGEDEEGLAALIAGINREAVMLSIIRHDNVLNFRGVVLADGPHAHPKYILFELAEASLSDFLDNLDRRFTMPEVWQLGVHVLSGLEYLAAYEIVHRDLKPANILVFVGRDRHVTYKIGDVGLARVIASRSSIAASKRKQSTLTANVGTPVFTAPEVNNPKVPYDCKVDVYSFGIVVMYVIANYVMPKGRFGKFSDFKEMFAAVQAFLKKDGVYAKYATLIDQLTNDVSQRPTAAEALEMWMALHSDVRFRL